MVWLLPYVLAALGVGFLIANVRAFADIVRYRRKRKNALLIWPGPPPPFYGLVLFLGVALGMLIFVKLIVLHRTLGGVFGEAMMFVYFGYAVPLTRRIGRGFYADGVWSEHGFIPYHEIGGIAWREGEPITLLLVPRFKQLARSLTRAAAPLRRRAPAAPRQDWRPRHHVCRRIAGPRRPRRAGGCLRYGTRGVRELRTSGC